MILLYITHVDEKHAYELGRNLIESKLAACINFIPTKSMYNFENNLLYESEIIMIVKTLKILEARIYEKIEKLHTYKIPCILKFDVEANEQFYKFVEEQLIKKP